MNKPRRKSSKSRRSSSRSVVSNSEKSGNDPDVRIIRNGGEVHPSDIPSIKWREIIRDEEQDFIVNSIREEIIGTAMDAIYSRYLKKASYGFVVHCSRRAWLDFFNFTHLKHDPGENVQTIAERWSYDEAPDPVPPDPWACRRMTVNKEKLSSPVSDACTSSCSTKNNIEPVVSVPFFTCPTTELGSSSQLSNTEESVEGEERDSKPDTIVSKPSSSVGDDGTSLASSNERQRSIFTRTISMVKADLPVPRWQAEQRHKHSTHACRDKSFHSLAEAVESPERLDLEKLPAER